MCGIAGLMMKGSRPLPAGVLDKLITALRRRGPDGEGTFVHDNLGLVHTRLSILDVENGAQPLFDPVGRVLIANGEVYNNKELRETYRHYPYKTESDSESILMLWGRYGIDALKLLRGMYAFALFDPQEGALYLARDPYGIKPLYYIDTPEYLAFASEPQALIAAALAHPCLEAQSTKEVLQLRFSTAQNTPFQGIKRLKPGEVLKIIAGNVVAHSHVEGISSFCLSEATAPVEDLDSLISESVRLHLRSDVPYGLFLSGGIDSSCILSLMRRHHTGTLRTYSIGFPGTQMYDERAMARKMASSVDADHMDLDFTEGDFWTLLPQVALALDDPVVDYAALPTFKLAQVASSQVKVVLCGEGGDEVFAGYRRYQKARLPRVLGGRLWREKGVFSRQPWFDYDLKGWDSAIHDTLQALQQKPYTRLQIAQAIDFQHWLPNDLLTKLDRCLMFHGVEGRTPFVDKEIVPFGFYLPDHEKVTWRMRKRVLRQWLARHFPVADPYGKKRGFKVPVGEWLCKEREKVERWVAHQPGITELLAPEKVRAFFQNLKPSDAIPAWSLLFYSVWHHIHILRQPLDKHLLLSA